MSGSAEAHSALKFRLCSPWPLLEVSKAQISSRELIYMDTKEEIEIPNHDAQDPVNLGFQMYYCLLRS